MAALYLIEDLTRGVAIPLGNQCESEANEIRFDVSAWALEYPESAIIVAQNTAEDGMWLTFTRCGESIVYQEPPGYLSVSVEEERVSLIWVPSDSVMDVAGIGTLVIHLNDGGVEKRSVMCSTFVTPGHAASVAAPAPLDDYLDKWGAVDIEVEDGPGGVPSAASISQDEDGTHIVLTIRPGAKVVSAEFLDGDMVFALDDESTVVIAGAEELLRGPQGVQGIEGEAGPQGVPGVTGAEGPPGVSGVYVGTEAPAEGQTVWFDTDGTPTKLYFKDKYVETTDWVADNTYPEFPFKCDIPCVGATSAMYASVSFGYSEIVSGNFAPICSTSTDVVTIYASAVPSTDITIPIVEVLSI